MKSNRSLTMIGIVVGWGFFVIVGVHLVEWGLQLWQRQAQGLSQAQQQLSRLQGWISVEKEVEARRNDVLGPFAHVAGTDLSWVSLQGLQQMATAQGLVVTELRPSQSLAQGGQPRSLRLDAKLEGAVSQIGGLLQHLPEIMPGVRLDNVQLVPQQKEGRIQLLVQLTLPELSQR